MSGGVSKMIVSSMMIVKWLSQIISNCLKWGDNLFSKGVRWGK